MKNNDFMKTKIAGFISNISLQYKLFLVFILLIPLPFLVYMFINNYTSSRNAEDQAIYSASQMMAQSSNYLESKIDLINNTMNMVANNDTIQALIKKKADIYNDNLGLWNFDLQQAEKQFYYLQPADDIVRIRLYTNGGFTDIDETDSFKNLNKVRDTSWYKKLALGVQPIQWYSMSNFTEVEKEDYITAVRRISDSEDLKQWVGVIRVDLKESMFKTVLRQTKYTSTSSVLLINSSNEVICSTESQTSTSDLISRFTSTALTTQSDGQFQGYIGTGKSRDIFLAQNITGTDWRFIQAIPYPNIYSMIHQANKQLLVIILMVIILALPVSYLISSYGTKRFRALISQMKRAETGDFNVGILPGSKDEIGQLTIHFNHMLTKIAMLMDEQYALGQKIKNTELIALQSQINPHFLYNALDQINWMGMENNVPEISAAVQEISRFYRLSLSKGQSIVTIENELEHVKAYVYIQNIRFSHAIQLEIDVPEELLQHKIPKITLQPIVENAILHGILESEKGRGTVHIIGQMVEGSIFLSIEDDGVGMTVEEMRNILLSSSTDDFHGYGIKNINEKLSLMYGEEYGLTFEGRAKGGTSVTIRIP